jgi:hypothetical protein
LRYNRKRSYYNIAIERAERQRENKRKRLFIDSRDPAPHMSVSKVERCFKCETVIQSNQVSIALLPLNHSTQQPHCTFRIYCHLECLSKHYNIPPCSCDQLQGNELPLEHANINNQAPILIPIPSATTTTIVNHDKRC